MLGVLHSPSAEPKSVIAVLWHENYVEARLLDDDMRLQAHLQSCLQASDSYGFLWCQVTRAALHLGRTRDEENSQEAARTHVTDAYACCPNSTQAAREQERPEPGEMKTGLESPYVVQACSCRKCVGMGTLMGSLRWMKGK